TAGTVAPGGQLSVSVAFAPTEAAAYSAALTFSTNDVSQPTVTIALSGYGVFAAPHVHLVEGSHDYGPVRVDVGPTVAAAEAAASPESAVRWPLRIVNFGAEPLVVTDVQTEDPAFIPLAGGFPYTVATLDTLVVE